MRSSTNGIRVGAAAFALAASLIGPQAAGVATADRGGSDPAGVSANPEQSAADRQNTPPRSERNGIAINSPGAVGSTGSSADSATPGARRAAAAPQRTGTTRRGAATPAEPIVADLSRQSATTSAPQRAASKPGPPTVPVTPSAAVVAPEVVMAPEAVAAVQESPVGLVSAPPTATAPAVTPLPSAAAATTVSTCPECAVIARAVTSPPDVLASLNTAVVGFFDAAAHWLSGLPAGPVSEIVSGALLLVRRTLFNQAPSVQPVQVVATLAPQIEGDLGAVDVDGDMLRYEVVEAPKFGTVQIGPDGRYVYTADAGDAPPGYSPSLSPDSFTVAVSDTGFNLLNPFGSRSVQTTVQIGALAGSPVETYDYRVVNLSRYAVTVVTVDNSGLEPTGTAAHEAIMQARNMPPVGTVLTPGQAVDGTITRFDEDIAASPAPAASAGLPEIHGYSKLVFQRADRQTLWTVFMVIASASRPAEIYCDASYCTFPATSTERKTILLTDRPGTLIDIYPETQGGTELLAGLEAASAELGAETLSVARSGGDVIVRLTGPCVSEYSCASNYGQVQTLQTWTFHGTSEPVGVLRYST